MHADSGARVGSLLRAAWGSLLGLRALIPRAARRLRPRVAGTVQPGLGLHRRLASLRELGEAVRQTSPLQKR